MYKGHSLATVSHKLTSNLFPCQCDCVYNQKLLQGSILMIEHGESSVLHLFM